MGKHELLCLDSSSWAFWSHISMYICIVYCWPVKNPEQGRGVDINEKIPRIIHPLACIFYSWRTNRWEGLLRCDWKCNGRFISEINERGDETSMQNSTRCIWKHIIFHWRKIHCFILCCVGLQSKAEDVPHKLNSSWS